MLLGCLVNVVFYETVSLKQSLTAVTLLLKTAIRHRIYLNIEGEKKREGKINNLNKN